MMARWPRIQRRSGFTRIDLLVVIVIVAVLGGMLPLVLNKAKETSRRARCTGNLRQIGVAAALYAEDNNNSFFQRGSSIPNDGQWTLNPLSPHILPMDHLRAYWGIGYWNYYGGAKEIFGCPSAQTVDEWRDDDRYYPKEFWKHSTYGMPNLVISPFETKSDYGPRKLSDYKSPQTMILCQDAAEQKMEGPDDTLGLFPGKTQILEQWIGSPPGSGGLGKLLYDGYAFEWEWYRHRKVCNTLWVPGNVSGIKFNNYQGVDYRWYTGDEPLEQPKF